MKELKSSAIATERRNYLPDWPGFHRVFGLHMRGAGDGCHIDLDTSLEAEFRTSPTPHIVLADRLLRAIQVSRHAALNSMCCSYTSPSTGHRASSAALARTSICTIT
jgi:hypothetical protein